MEEDFIAEQLNNINDDIRFLDLSMITTMIDTVRQRTQSMVHIEDQLLKLISCIDLTSLNSDDTDDVINHLIDKAILPYPAKPETKCAAVCVYPARVAGAKRYLHSKYQQQSLTICSVAAGFPSGQYRIESKILEVKLAMEDGADEIDVVISRDAAIEYDWKRIYNEIAALKRCCSLNCMKTILATGELQNEQDIYRASWTAMLAGSDFIKTSTGKEKVNATYEAAYVMCHAIKQFYSITGKKVGFKAAGGIRSTQEALGYQAMVEEILGTEWLKPNLFRIGASSLLDDIIKKLNEV
ncbi:putative deoxyribose-phosphate aldolase [Dirofilaria immitis]|nr:Deoxyribose-phosphate aldolase [Dirofilaria immitis]